MCWVSVLSALIRETFSYPFVFGDGAIRARHKGMVISERRCRAVYNERLKEGVRSIHRRQWKPCFIEKVVLGE